MRCNDCNKFVSFDTEGDPEVDLDVNPEGNVTGTVRIVNTCQECSAELKEYTFEVDEDFDAEIAAHRTHPACDCITSGNVDKPKDEPDDAHAQSCATLAEVCTRTDDLTVSHDGGSRTDRTANKDRHGKPIKSSRYMKHYYGADLTITVECACGETWEKSWSDEVQASGMDEL